MLSTVRLARSFTETVKLFTRSIICSRHDEIVIKKETIAEHVFSYCDKYSDKIAFIDDFKNVNYKYSDVKRSVNSIASALTKKGVKPGSMAAIIASNSPEYMMLLLAISSMGCSVTICNQNFTSNEMKHQMLDSLPSIIFTNGESLEKVSQVASLVKSVKDIYLIGSRKSGYESVDDLLNDSGNTSPIGSVRIDYENMIALMPYSSGTTGLPKGVMLTHTNLVSNFDQINSAHRISDHKVMLACLPLYHIYATVIIPSMAFYSGSAIVFQPRFDPKEFLAAIVKHKISVLHLVPPQILFLLNHPDVKKYDLSSIEKCFSAAAPLDALIENRFIETHRVHNPEFDVYQAYGLSETSPMTHIIPNIKKLPGKQGSVGILVPNMQCKVNDFFKLFNFIELTMVNITTRKEVFVNEEAEILVRGPNVMKGYFGKAAETETAFEDNWFKTGDIGHYDEDHYFYISDRIKELIKVKGHQVAPAELEAVLLSFPGIADCAVIGVKDDRDGEVPKAFVVKNRDIKENEIHEFINSHLSPYKQLKGGIVFIDKIPKSASGKILRRLLRNN